jgi:hypothetical protein
MLGWVVADPRSPLAPEGESTRGPVVVVRSKCFRVLRVGIEWTSLVRFINNGKENVLRCNFELV